MLETTKVLDHAGRILEANEGIVFGVVVTLVRGFKSLQRKFVALG